MQALEELTRTVIVSPDAASVKAIADEWPGFYESLADVVSELAGLVPATIRK